MRDELDGQLLGEFAAGQRPLADAQFVVQVRRQLHARAGVDALVRVLNGAVRAILDGLAVGVAAPLRLRYAGLLALAAAGTVVWTLVVSSL